MNAFAKVFARLVFVYCVVAAIPAWALDDAPTAEVLARPQNPV